MVGEARQEEEKGGMMLQTTPDEVLKSKFQQIPGYHDHSGDYDTDYRAWSILSEVEFKEYLECKWGKRTE